MIDKYASNFLCINKKKSLFLKQNFDEGVALYSYFTSKIILTKEISRQVLRLWNAIFAKSHFLYIFVLVLLHSGLFEKCFS
jgi:hypothetical protein